MHEYTQICIIIYDDDAYVSSRSGLQTQNVPVNLLSQASDLPLDVVSEALAQPNRSQAFSNDLYHFV